LINGQKGILPVIINSRSVFLAELVTAIYKFGFFMAIIG